jgi:hypothetical protein
MARPQERTVLPVRVDPGHSRHSSLRANILEHVFLAELLRALWTAGHRQIEVLRSEVDSAGYDVVVVCDGITRYIQLKSSHRLAKTRRVDVNTRIVTKQGGCVIWMLFDGATLAPHEYLWFGGCGTSMIPEIGERVGRHSRGAKKPRPAIRVLTRTQFDVFPGIEDLVRQLFGRIAPRS